MMNREFELFTNRHIEPQEIAELMASVGWATESDYEPQEIARSITSYTFVAHTRNSAGRLIGYISAFSDGAFSTCIGELVVKPEYQRMGLGRTLIEAVEKRFKGVPIYAKAFESEKGFFVLQGYSEPKRPMIVVSKRN